VCDLSPTCPALDVAIDGADEVDGALDCVKGGGGCQTLEKIVAAAAATFVVVTDYTKRSERLLTVWRKGVPVEVLALALTPVSAALRALGGSPVLRMGAPAKAGPAVTDNGNLLLDVDFGGGAGLPGAAAALHAAIKGLPGVVETGLFCGMAQAVIYGEQDGSITHVKRSGSQ
jgi:ribose 5-phosphate isomerase A